MTNINVPTSIRLKADYLEILKEIAVDKDRSLNYLINQAVKEYLKDKSEL